MERIINEINNAAQKFKKISDKHSRIRILTHYDSDGITSGAILSRALQRADCNFHTSIVKLLENKIIEQVREEKNWDILFILDLCGDLESIKKIERPVFILDHHETEKTDLPENITLVNPFLINKAEEISGAGLAYLFSKGLDEHNKDLSQLAIVGMIGDILAERISKIYNFILNDSDAIVRRDLPLLNSTKPLHKALEFSSSLFIPRVTGSSDGAIDLMREIGIKPSSDVTLLTLNKEELKGLITAIILRRIEKMGAGAESILGNVYILNFFNRLEDGREMSSLLNACGRLDYGDVALTLCMGCEKSKQEAERIYEDYKKYLIESLNYVKNFKERLKGEGYVIYNCKNAVKDSIIGTVISILSLNELFPAGDIIVGMAYREDEKIKVSARISRNRQDIKKNEINLKELLCKVCADIIDKREGEFGGHSNAAGCLIPANKEDIFITALEKELIQRQIKLS